MENAILDERASLSVANIMPGALMSFLKSIKKLPARVALLGDIVPLKDEKVFSKYDSWEERMEEAKLALESLRNTILSEQNAISQASYSVSGILSSSSISCGSRSEHLQEVLEQSNTCLMFGNDCMKIKHMEFNISGRLFILVGPDTASDACMVSVDHKGFDILGKVPGEINKDGFSQYKWKEFRFTFKEEAHDIETFCRYLVEMEEEALKNVSSYSGLGLV
ncbi:hypothetical protein ACLOJK_029922 [Asimina triloba]